MTAVPVIPVAAVNEDITADWWNNQAAPAIAFSQNPPLCDLANNNGQALPDGAATLMTWDTDYVDKFNMHDPSLTPTQVFALYPGRYAIDIYVTLPSTSATYTQLDINPRINAAGSATGGTSIRTFNRSPTNGQSVSRESEAHYSKVLAENDYLQVFVTQTSGASRTTTAAGVYCTGFQMRWVGLY